MLPHLLVNRAFDVENEKTSEKRATAKSWCGNWVIWRANRMGELRRKERSQLACTVALESPLECLPKGGAEDSGASLLGRRYPAVQAAPTPESPAVLPNTVAHILQGGPYSSRG
jgi:hypothetical protein